MNKADLNRKWSKYCDTDKLVDDTMALLTKYRHRNSEHGVCVMLDTYFTNKEPLIKLISNSKNYLGDMRIAVQKEFDRQLSNSDIYNFIREFENHLSSCALLKKKDDDNKSLWDYFNTGADSFNLDSLPSAETQDVRLSKMRQFDYARLVTAGSWQRYNEYNQYLQHFRGIYHSTIPRNYQYGDGPELKMGTKTSRAFNHVCNHYGIDKMNPETVTTVRNGKTIERTVYPYDKLFAQFADLVSDIKRKLYFVISLNPLDYLTMSVGVNWRSCHHIQDGGWKGGCMSYMLDESSMITFVINTLEGNIHETPKYYRQMYHYQHNLFVQNRLYPQGNDGATDLYAKFRGYVIDEFSELLGLDNNWVWQAGTGNYVNSYGTHYRDYGNNRKCGIFVHKSKIEDINRRVTIGHNGICTYCGREYTDSYSFAHGGCSV